MSNYVIHLPQNLEQLNINLKNCTHSARVMKKNHEKNCRNSANPKNFKVSNEFSGKRESQNFNQPKNITKSNEPTAKTRSEGSRSHNQPKNSMKSSKPMSKIVTVEKTLKITKITYK